MPTKNVLPCELDQCLTVMQVAQNPQTLSTQYTGRLNQQTITALNVLASWRDTIDDSRAESGHNNNNTSLLATAAGAQFKHKQNTTVCHKLQKAQTVITVKTPVTFPSQKFTHHN